MRNDLIEHEDTVRPEWVDYNGHMNLAYYVLIFDHATDALFDALDIGRSYCLERGKSNFVLETHTIYEREVGAGDPLRVRCRLLAADAKRLHFFHEMFHASEGFRSATQELVSLHVDLADRRAAPFPPDRAEAIAALLATQATLPVPDSVGRRVALSRR